MGKCFCPDGYSAIAMFYSCTVCCGRSSEEQPSPVLCRLCDKSLMVRKKALQLLGALLALELPPVWHQLLSSSVLPVATKLLGVKPDSELHSGEEAAQVLPAIFMG